MSMTVDKPAWSKCGVCPIADPAPCLYQSWRRCPVPHSGPAGRARLIAAAERAASFDGRAPDVPLDAMMRIALCSARESACHCVGKPALCRRDGPPVEVVCLTAGPGGGPCPGA